MNNTTRIIIAVAVVAVAALAFVAKQNKSTSPAVPVGGEAMAATAQSPGANATATPSSAKAKVARLVDLGAGKCIPCKMMKPILDDLKANYTDHFSTEFIDVWENPDAGKQYGIEVIPTQIFYNAEGKELFRHVGFYGKEDILGKWKDLGVDVAGKPSAGIVRETPMAADTRLHKGAQTNPKRTNHNNQSKGVQHEK